MEVFIPSRTARCPDISSSGGSSTIDPHNLFHNKEDLSMIDLKACLIELLNVEETGISTSCFNLAQKKIDNIGNVLRESKCKDLQKSHATGFSASEKCISKYTTFPPPSGPKIYGDVFVGEKEKQKSPDTGFSASEKCISKYTTFLPPSGPKIYGDVFVGEKEKQKLDITAEVSQVNGSINPFNQCYSRSTSLPVPLTLVSALKGGREKQQQGTSPKKLSVTWAPDVYDPIPTSVSHVPSDKNQRYRYYGKKNGKYKQKSSGKSSRGSKSKEKKQGRKSL